MADVKAPRQRAQYTKELVKIAMASGTPQKRIAELCRVQQSVVSNWANGKAKAYVDQLAPVYALYGARLNRRAAKVYRVRNPNASDAGWEETEAAQALQEDRLGDAGILAKCGIAPGQIHAETPDEWRHVVETLYRENFAQLRAPPALIRVDGAVALRYTFWRGRKVLRRTVQFTVKEPWRRWIIHRQASGHFVVVVQNRLRHFGDAVVMEQRGILDVGDQEQFWVEAQDDAARWMSVVHTPVTPDGLIAWVDAQAGNPQWHQRDLVSLPFLVRKMLADQGFSFSGLEVAPTTPAE